MNVIEVFGNNLKNIALLWECHKKRLRKSAACTVHT